MVTRAIVERGVEEVSFDGGCEVEREELNHCGLFDDGV